jgi:phosphoglycerate dehydrogenase-like enzyme
VTLGTCAVLIPPEGGPHVHGGDRYRRIADATLSSHVDIRHVAWSAAAPATWDDVLDGADALVVSPWLSLLDPPSFEGFRLDLAPELKVIAGTFDFRLGWIDLEAADRRSVVVVDTSRTMTPTVAEFGVAIMLSLLRDIPLAIDIVRSGAWFEGPRDEPIVFRDLADCRVGLAGYGSINRHVRRFLEGFGCEVAAFDPFVPDAVVSADRVIRTGSLVELARTSDVFVVAIPPTPATLGVIDATVIDALGVGSLFVLLSRMAVVQQEPLWRRLRAGELRAAIDVFDPEPPPHDAWFRRAPNVLPTPHIAGNVSFAHERCFREACEDAMRVLRGDPAIHAATVRDRDLYDGSLAADVGRGPTIRA